MKKCCFFGHAVYRYEDYREAIKAAIISLIENEGVSVFYSGGRGDFDHLCAHIVGELSKSYPDLDNIKFLSYISVTAPETTTLPITPEQSTF